MTKTTRRFLAIVALLALTGCPYSEGCDAYDASVDPNNPANLLDGGGDGEADPNGKPVDIVDFGTEPVGGPRLSTLTCPALKMPALPPPPAKPPIYVDGKATGPEEGTKEKPFHTLKKAFSAAKLKGIVLVAAGTYLENTVVPDKDLAMLGGFSPDFATRSDACATVLEAADPTQPILAGDNTIRGFTIEGFKFQKGSQGLSITGDETVETGFIVARCVFVNNGTRKSFGGGVALNKVSSRLFQSVIKDNIGFKGAGVFMSGGKITVDQNLFEHNLGYSDHGGGLYVVPGDVPAKVTRNTFKGNATGVDMPPDIYGAWGGGAIVDAEETPTRRADFSYNLFTENTAGIGGGIFIDQAGTLTLSHDLFYLNRGYPEGTATAAFVHGPAIYVDGTGEPGGGSTLLAEYITVVNNIFDAKGAPFDTQRMYGGNIHVEENSHATVKNSIFFGNGANAFYIDATSDITISYTLGPSECTSANAEGFIKAPPSQCKIGQGVFDAPEVSFADLLGGDFHERSAAGRFFNGQWVKDPVTSPAIDKADPADPVKDEPAPNGGRANLGCFGGTNEGSKTP